jgi:ketosteroid isomerase-like protein
VTAIDDDRVLVTWVPLLRGKQSGAVGSQRAAAVITVRDGKIVRSELYSSREQALEAVGLSE